MEEIKQEKSLKMLSESITKKLYLSFATPLTWRWFVEEKISKDEWRVLRFKILKRDDFTCKYCGFRAEKWQIIHHIDGNPKTIMKAIWRLFAPCAI